MNLQPRDVAAHPQQEFEINMGKVGQMEDQMIPNPVVEREGSIAGAERSDPDDRAQEVIFAMESCCSTVCSYSTRTRVKGGSLREDEEESNVMMF